VAVIEGYFAKTKATAEASNSKTSRGLADILSVRQANLLAKQGILDLADVSKLSEVELLAMKSAGQDLIQTLRRNKSMAERR
jgi:DNA-directed RNA polymerase alpha subunit